MRKLDEAAIRDIAMGAAVLGTGGGGDPHIGMLMALQAVEECGPIDLIDCSSVPDDALVMPLAMMGAPTVMVEKIPSSQEFGAAFTALRDYLGKEVFATMPIEAGGVNSMMPLVSAAKLGLPVIDADGMGRAFPELQMVTFHLHGIKATPMVMTDEKGNLLLLETIDNVWTEQLARNATVVMGGSTMIAIYPMSGRQVKDCAIKNPISLAWEIGKVIRKRQGDNVVQELLKVTGGYELYRGKVVDVIRRTVGGFARGEAVFDGIDDYRGQPLSIEFQNENLIARSGDDVVACVPDLITILDAETGMPITTEGIRYGFRVIVIGMPCDLQWRSAGGLETVGPRYFGYDVDYMAIEERFGKEGRS